MGLKELVCRKRKPPGSKPGGNGAAAAEKVSGMPVLEGGPCSQVLMPLDYPPSRRLQPRWGHTHPSHPGLVALFDKRRDDYREVIRGVRALQPWLAAIPAQFTSETAPEPGWVGGPMTALDLAILYYFVARSRARVYLEVGSGVSTCFARRAISDHRLPTRIVSIDPEPRAAIDRICDEVVRRGLEEADLGIFETLRPGDILFIDGSHRSFMNSDVTVLMLDVIPRLAPGVIVHLHDITLPNDYPEMFRYWYWNEQYLLAVYLLASGDRVRVLMPSHFVQIDAELSQTLAPPIATLPSGQENFFFGGSLWFTHQ
jgi:hypothetical protein